MRVNAMWRGKKLRKYAFLGITDLMDFVRKFGIPVDELEVFYVDQGDTHA